MARSLSPSSSGFNIAGVYEHLTAHQSEAVVRVDLRRLDWSLPASGMEAQKAALRSGERRRSELLDALVNDESVVIPWSLLPPQRRAGRPGWLTAPTITPWVRVDPDDRVYPSDDPPLHCAW